MRQAATYHKRFIWMYSEIMHQLYSLLKKDRSKDWTEECQHTFYEVKRILTTTRIFVNPNWSMEFYIHCDASNIAIGAVLAQNNHGKVNSLIYYANTFLNNAKKNCSIHERVVLAMVYSVQNFGTTFLANHCVFYVDHQALLYLINRPVVSGRLMRWMLLL